MGFRPLQRLGQEKRPAPGLPHPAVLHSQAFSTSQCFIPLLAVPALFHAGSTHGVLDPAELSPPEDRVPFRFPLPSCRYRLPVVLDRGRERPASPSPGYETLFRCPAWR